MKFNKEYVDSSQNRKRSSQGRNRKRCGWYSVTSSKSQNRKQSSQGREAEKLMAKTLLPEESQNRKRSSQGRGRI